MIGAMIMPPIEQKNSPKITWLTIYTGGENLLATSINQIFAMATL